MRIKQLKINNYGKLKDQEIKLKPNINIIYGKNEAGKSTLLNFITNTFYGISKNKNGKEISDFEKYTPWVGEEFSGKLTYQLENKEEYEVFRDFRKKNPKIYNEKMEDISKEFNIDKAKGNEFFYEQTKVDETLFLSTIVTKQQEVKLEKQEQNILVQKIANLVGTGEDNVSYKRAMDRINRRIADEIGTARTREKPINLLEKEINQLQEKKKELEEVVSIKYEIEENKKRKTEEIENLEEKIKQLKKVKLEEENAKIEKEKINLKISLKNENQEKMKNIENQINNIKSENKSIFEKGKKVQIDKNKLNKKAIILFLGIILMNILQWVTLTNNFFKYLILLTIPVTIVFIVLLKKKQKNKQDNLKNKIEKVETKIKQLNFEKELLQKNNQELEKEISDGEVEKKEENKLENINWEIQELEDKFNSKKVELHTLQIDYQNIEPNLENLSNIEEKLVNAKKEMANLKSLEQSMYLAKEALENAYEKMKNTITPKFTDKLSETIAKITKEKYSKVKLNEENGLVIELENGNYLPVNRLSLGTIDQLYLSLRLALVEELSEEKMPIILDETFAYYDEERLKNVLTYIAKRFQDHQIILFTCTNREKEILEKQSISFHWVVLDR